MRVIGYLRVSTREQAHSHLGLDAQREAIEREANHRGWEVHWIADEGFTGKNDRRPGLQLAKRLLRSHQHSTLVVAKLDRLSRSVQDFAGLVKDAKAQRWAIVSLDPEIDMTTTNGRLFARILIDVAEWESEIIGDRTKAAMAVAKNNGVHYGRPTQIPPQTVNRIKRLRNKGLSYRQIAAELDRTNTPLARDGQTWQHSTVSRILAREAN